ncbi:MAG: hypothetical protein JNK71_00090 [Methyloversatilis sp.]|nr:hypothetical protein [Methyloversatilis sp.]
MAQRRFSITRSPAVRRHEAGVVQRPALRALARFRTAERGDRAVGWQVVTAAVGRAHVEVPALDPDAQRALPVAVAHTDQHAILHDALRVGFFDPFDGRARLGSRPFFIGDCRQGQAGGTDQNDTGGGPHFTTARARTSFR